MASYEANITLIRNRKRLGGSVTIGISRLGVALMLLKFRKGMTIQQAMERYPQLDRDTCAVLAHLAKEIQKYWK